MIKIDATNMGADFKKLRKQVSKESLKKAIRITLNTTMRKQRTIIAKDIKNTYPEKALKQGAIKRSGIVSLRNATTSKLKASLSTNSKAIPLMYFNAKQVPNNKGVSFELYKGKRTVLKRAFIGKKRNGKKMKPRVFSKGRYVKNAFLYRKNRINKSGNDLPITGRVGFAVGAIPPESLHRAELRVIQTAPKILNEVLTKIIDGKIKP